MTDAISHTQCRMARVGLGWTQQDLAGASGGPVRTVAAFELGETRPRRLTIEAIKRAFEAAGITFLAEGQESQGGGPGIRMSMPET